MIGAIICFVSFGLTNIHMIFGDMEIFGDIHKILEYGVCGLVCVCILLAV